MPIMIREAIMEDKEGIKNLISELNQYHVGLQPSVFNVLKDEEILPQNWFENIITDNNKSIFVAEHESKLIGFALISIFESPDDPLFKKRKWVFVEELSVLASQRGKGIGTNILKYVEEYGKKIDVDSIRMEVWSNNENAINLYQKMGFASKKFIMWKELK